MIEAWRYEMEKLPRRIYTQEYRAQAVKRVIEQRLTVPEAARHLSMSAKTPENQVYRARHGKLEGMDAHRVPVTGLEAVVSRLKRELAEVRMERDILIKKRRRSSPSNPVRRAFTPAASLSHGGAVSGIRGLRKRLPPLACAPTVEAHPHDVTTYGVHD